MRKLLFTLALASVVTLANAQTLTTKEGNAILPESGDWSFSIDAAPLGTLFRDNGSSAFSNQYLIPMTIVGKYMKSNTSAIRGKLRIGFGNESVDSITVDNTSTSTPPGTVTDTRTDSYTSIILGAGIQNYRGKGRIQGYYGAEALIALGSSGTEYTYGNGITPTNQTPTRTDFGGNVLAPGTFLTEDNSGSTFGFGVRGFVGVEYFFAAKMSFGVEYGWGLGMVSTGEGEVVYEAFDPSSNAAKSTTANSGGNSTFGLDVDNASGAVFFSFYF